MPIGLTCICGSHRAVQVLCSCYCGVAGVWPGDSVRVETVVGGDVVAVWWQMGQLGAGVASVRTLSHGTMRAMMVLYCW